LVDRIQIEYRLTKCPELCLGVFCTVVPEEAKDFDLATLPLAKPVETDRQNGAVSVLLAHIVATRSNTHVVADADMDYPRDWKSSHGKSSEVGHQEDGRTVAIHSLAVAPRLQGCGLGKLIMKSYLQQINNSGTAERVALICQHVSRSDFLGGRRADPPIVFGDLLPTLRVPAPRREQVPVRRGGMARHGIPS